MSPDAPTAWTIYIGTDDADALAQRVQAAGGTVVAPPFDVGDQGRMATFQDSSGAFISVWQPRAMAGAFESGVPNTFGWAELNARGFHSAKPFYKAVFGWTAKDTEGAGQPYTEFQLEGTSIAGGMEMNPMVPAEVPSYWMVYFNVADVDQSFKDATGLRAQEMLAPQDFPGGRFAIVSDPQGAMFGVLKMDPTPPAARKSTGRRSTSKASAKKTSAKKATSRKAAAKKATSRKRSSAKKATRKRATAKKATRASTKKSTRRSPAKRSSTKKATSRTSRTRTSSRKAGTRKSPSRKGTARRSSARRATRRTRSRT
jgi:predicted enzyme related to lactoylglutathione lyase